MASRLPIDPQAVAAFCRRHHVRRLALFGSVPRDDLTPESDVDVLVELEPGFVSGLRFFSTEEELSTILGRKVDFDTPGFLGRYFRDRVLKEADEIGQLALARLLEIVGEAAGMVSPAFPASHPRDALGRDGWAPEVPVVAQAERRRATDSLQVVVTPRTGRRAVPSGRSIPGRARS